VKTLYRVIAKTTHPDKVNDDSLKELYLEATKA
jgi:curved DNA-binding protein CbpA